MGIIIKRIKELTLQEWNTVNLFYLAVCEMPADMIFENYNEKQTMCAKIEGRSLEKGMVIGALLFQEIEQSVKEFERYGKAKVIAIDRVDVRPEKRNRGVGTGLFKLALDYIDAKCKKPYLARIGKDIFPSASQKMGFVQKNYYCYKYVA